MKWVARSQVAGFVLMGLCAIQAYAQGTNTYPDRPVRILVPYAPGGTVDTVARQVANAVSKELGQPIIIENKPGAAGAIARAELTRSAPDGYTLMADAVGSLVASTIANKKGFEIGRDFAPIGTMARQPFFLAVKNELPVKTLGELVALAKAKPGTLAYGSPGKGSEAHLVVELLEQSAGLRMTHVPYKGGTLAVTDLSAGILDFLTLTQSTLRPALERKSVRIIATLGPNRSALMPDVPTTKELGYPAFTHVPTIALFTVAKTPAPIVARWNDAMNKVKDDKTLATWGAASASEISISNAQTLAKLYQGEVSKWKPLIEKLDLTE
ncbi:MAG: hypothetical protein JWQ07_4499 [Ramlibacter sp.]|nr:hypothetical protein [Ramlibacter sp.]